MFLPAATVIEDPTQTVISESTLRFVFHFFLSVFLFLLCFPIDPLLRPEYLLLLLEQGERSLEGHTRLFLVLASLTTYPDNALCVLYNASLNSLNRTPSSEDGPQANFATFVEWTLVRNGSLFPACSQENIASSTSDPVPSPPSPRCAERMPEPTTDLEPEPSVNDEQSLHGATEPRIAEQELLMTSVKVREPATTSDSRERAMDGVSAERSSAPCTVAEGELRMARGLCHSKEERAPFPEFSPRRTPVPAPGKYPPEPCDS